MLQTPKFSKIVRAYPKAWPYKILDEGILIIPSFSLEDYIEGESSFRFMYPLIQCLNFSSYGVCDTPAQFLSRYREKLAADPRTFVVGFTHIEKREEEGGWRWHKWGRYFGEGKPTCEYLADEEGFAEGVYVFHIMQLSGPELELKDFPVSEDPPEDGYVP